MFCTRLGQGISARPVSEDQVFARKNLARLATFTPAKTTWKRKKRKLVFDYFPSFFAHLNNINLLRMFATWMHLNNTQKSIPKSVAVWQTLHDEIIRCLITNGLMYRVNASMQPTEITCQFCCFLYLLYFSCVRVSSSLVRVLHSITAANHNH